MISVDTKPMSRGVTHLMYVGDDEAVENAVAGPGALELAASVAGVVYVLQDKDIPRPAAWGIAAYLAYRALKPR